ncbi:MAG: transketolase C-terminal domain-containing protein, partial [Tissierellia bacterium]|nr:transketolase C-terminal domain-containing protein [Tissierellia bacterium]
SEVQLAVEAAKKIEENNIGVRVVSMPSFELFEEQSYEYKEEVLPNSIRKRVAIEAAVSFGWHKYTGLDGKIIAIDSFGASAPGNKLFEEYNITVDNLVNTALEYYE